MNKPAKKTAPRVIPGASAISPRPQNAITAHWPWSCGLVLEVRGAEAPGKFPGAHRAIPRADPTRGIGPPPPRGKRGPAPQAKCAFVYGVCVLVMPVVEGMRRPL